MSPIYPLTVVDLDGTYVCRNTLHIYIMCGMRRMLAETRLMRLAKCMMLLAGRKLKLISHVKMKFGIFKLIDSSDPKLRCDFTAKVTAAINPAVKEIVDRADHVLLATAAPATYIPWIWDGDFVATDMNDNPLMIECRGEEKLRRVEDYISKQGRMEIRMLLTDHKDDLPLIHASLNTLMVNPKDKSLHPYSCQNTI